MDPAAYDLYLLIGQSNMAGRGELDAEAAAPSPRILNLDKSGSWVPARDPLHFDKPDIVGVGPGLAFALDMLALRPEATIGLVPCAVGGTSLSAWQPGACDETTATHPYDDALGRARVASRRGRIRAFLWHQGEADCQRDDGWDHAARLVELVERLRRELDAADAPFIAGEIGVFRDERADACHAMNRTLRGLEGRIPGYACVSSEGLADKGDLLHFNAAAARELGRRYAAALRRLQGATH